MLVSQPEAPRSIPSDPALVTAKAALSIEHPSNKVLYAKNPDELLEPAGLIQLLTAYVARKHLDDAALDQVVTVVKTDFLPKSAKPALEPGDQILVGDLFAFVCLVAHAPASGLLGRCVGEMLPGEGKPRPRFLGEVRRYVTAWGWQGAVIADLSGRSSVSRLSARMVAELLDRIAREDPLLFHMLGAHEHPVDIRGPQARTVTLQHAMADADRSTIPGVIAAKTGALKGFGGSLALVTDGEDGTGRTTVVMQSKTTRTRFADARAILVGDPAPPPEDLPARINIMDSLIGVRPSSADSGAFLEREGRLVTFSFVDVQVTGGGESLGVVEAPFRPVTPIVGSLVPDPLIHIAVHVDTAGSVRIIGGDAAEPVSGTLNWIAR